MNKNLKNHIEYLLCVKIERTIPVSGGDISKAFLLETATERFFCKVNLDASSFEMFQAEKAGLSAIAQTKTIATPKVFVCEKWETGSILLMEYIESKSPAQKNMELLGHQLAALHKLSSSETFGWESDNFIGSLPQSNKTHSDWTHFYVSERLLPQLKMAQDAKLLSSADIPTETQLLKTCELLFPETKPSLLHGDLWSGNYLIAQNGTPYLIDPAAYYGHHEVDIAMTRLFGGFDISFYQAYAEHYPEIGGEKERNDSYQLYYLLVHLNLFGASYYTACRNTIQKYFG